jgi:hypothetical protein
VNRLPAWTWRNNSGSFVFASYAPISIFMSNCLQSIFKD